MEGSSAGNLNDRLFAKTEVIKIIIIGITRLIFTDFFFNIHIIETISITKTIPITPVKLLVNTSERIGINETKYHQFFFLANANIKIIVGANQTAKKLG